MLANNLPLLLVCMLPLSRLLAADGEHLMFVAIGVIASTLILWKDNFLNWRGGLTYTDLFFFLFIVYTLVNTKGHLNARIVIQSVSILVIWVQIRCQNTLKAGTVVFLLMVCSSVQLTLLLLQWAHCIESNHAVFSYTGSYGNPAPLGCYFSMVLAFIVGYHVVCKEKNQKHRICLHVFSVILFMGIIITNSRTALLSVVCIPFVYFFTKLHESKSQKKILWCIVALLLVATFMVALYHVRPNSADARLRIWLSCIEFIRNAPILGHGSGSFTSTYMPFFSEYLPTQTTDIQMLADDIRSPYNELIHILYEQGIIGVILALLFFICAFRNLCRMNAVKDNIPCISLMISFAVIAEFSYPLSIPSLTCLCIALIANGVNSAWGAERQNEKSAMSIYCTRVFWSGISILFLSVIYLYTLANKDLKQYTCADQDISVSKDAIQFRNYEPVLLARYAQAQMLNGDYCGAVISLKRSLHYSNTTREHLLLAQAYENSDSIHSAIVHYEIAHRMRPSLMEPLYAQFCIFKESNSTKANVLAQRICEMQVKIENPKTRAMRSDAYQHLQTQIEKRHD